MDVGGLSGDSLGLNINVDLMINFRSICEDFINAKWKKIEEKENFYQEMHIESLLQRIILLRSSIRAYPGIVQENLNLHSNSYIST